MANSVITLDNVSFRYPDAGRDALSGVSLSIESGSFIAVLGHNGSGKSTLAGHFNGIRLPSIASYVPETGEYRLIRDFGYADYKNKLS